MSVTEPTYHFFSYRPAIRYHIARCLKELGWNEAPNAQQADLSDKNLVLNDDISQNLEYKHDLAGLVKRYCPGLMPLTYCIDDDNFSQVFSEMIYQHYMSTQRYEKTIPELKWILKPATLNNGDLIKLFQNVEELKQYYSTANRLGGPHVVQQYIPNPALIDGRKYTFRIHIVLTNYAGVFMYHQGYVNISAHPYHLQDGFVDRKVHITNYVLDGELSHIEQRSTQVLDNFSLVYPQMQNIAKRVIQGLLRKEPKYLKPQKTKIFEIFGLDFLLDQNDKLWLLEINQGPDAPTFEENYMNDILWKHFWQDIVWDFVYPVAFNQPPKNAYAHFSQILTAKQCYSWRAWWRR